MHIHSTCYEYRKCDSYVYIDLYCVRANMHA
jgi:hypothetical protein